MSDKFYQMVMLVRDGGESVIAWVDQSRVQDGAMIEMLDLPDPRNLWTIRHISRHVIDEAKYKQLAQTWQANKQNVT